MTFPMYRQKSSNLFDNPPKKRLPNGKRAEGFTNVLSGSYPNERMQYISKYEQDVICPTWEVLAEIVYPRGLEKLKKNAGGGYFEIGKAKCEWADRIGRSLHIHNNASPSYRYFISELEKRILE